MRLSPPPDWRRFLEGPGSFASSAGLRAWVVGGCVRDWILGKDTKDIDIVCEGDAEPLAQHFAANFGARIKCYGRFGTFSALLPDGLRVDLARARKEVYPHPAALPQVQPASIEEDLLRRDFAANAAAMSIMPGGFGDVIDPLGAAADIKSSVLRVLHDKSFYDDPTRLYRCCRFCGRFGWRMESNTERLFKEAIAAKIPALLSRARICRELTIILGEKNPKPAFKMMEEGGLCGFIDGRLRWQEAVLSVSSPAARFGVLAAAMGEYGPEFIKSLALERVMSVPIKSALKILLSKTAPRKPLCAIEKEILSAAPNPPISQ